ncbi:hypothetical protein H696_03341 [Fonticula alba]|uniref:Uncharacterized protein n=1 Tax=Fonticula alba TaxID=691883 RepID=A0A058Z6H8_FONAL|nr:hypothetical protein H696_03341 [Fonticula alba]KCV69870.1 hypothetical protein H696_03341 [Fonticula alba]|eukprot:XP_009495476.1 hypothetical protein H696_03341 [Fonticula alba]
MSCMGAACQGGREGGRQGEPNLGPGVRRTYEELAGAVPEAGGMFHPAAAVGWLCMAACRRASASAAAALAASKVMSSSYTRLRRSRSQRTKMYAPRVIPDRMPLREDQPTEKTEEERGREERVSGRREKQPGE